MENNENESITIGSGTEDYDTEVTGWEAKQESSNQSSNVKMDAVQAKAYQDIMIGYAKALEVGGFNVADHNFANAFYYNKSGLRLADPPQVGKSIIFITRPDLNWARPNIRAVPYFDYMFETTLGRQIFSTLTHPHRYINHTYASDDYPKQNNLIEQYFEIIKAAENVFNPPQNDIQGVNDYDLINKEMVSIMEQYTTLWKDNDPKQYDSDHPVIQTMKNNWGNDQIYDFRMNKEPQEIHSGWYTWEAWRVPFRPISGGKPSENNRDYIRYTSPFIPLFTNHCTELPGGRDILLSAKETEGDYYGGKLTTPTGIGEINSCGEITLTFEDNYWMQVFHTIYTWILYIDLVSRGEIMPRITNIWEKILDYTCSIYVFVLDKDQSFIRAWAKYTGCTPRSISMGGVKHSNSNDDFKTVSVPFAYNHVEYFDPQIFTDFNYVAGTEYERYIKKTFRGFSLHNSRKGEWLSGHEYTNSSAIFDYVQQGQEGDSGRFPERIVKLCEGLSEVSTQDVGDPEDQFRKLTNFEQHRLEMTGLNLQMPIGQRITYHNHWNGYPMIVSGRLVWAHKDQHPVKVSDDKSYDEDSEYSKQNEIDEMQKQMGVGTGEDYESNEPDPNTNPTANANNIMDSYSV